MIRAAGVAVALIVAAFFALGVRQATSTQAATRRVDAGRADHRTAVLLDHAGTLNPDADVDILRARLAVTRGNLPRARRILLDVVRREPENVFAWRLIQFVVEPIDPALQRRATRVFHRLAPPAPPA